MNALVNIHTASPAPFMLTRLLELPLSDSSSFIVVENVGFTEKFVGASITGAQWIFAQTVLRRRRLLKEVSLVFTWKVTMTFMKRQIKCYIIKNAYDKIYILSPHVLLKGMNGVAKDTQAFWKKKESQFIAKKIIPTGSYV